MALPSWTVMISWDGSGDWLGANDDVSADVRSLQIERGRDSELDDTQAGTLELRLKNYEGKYNPENTSSPLYENLEAGKPVKVVATLNTINYARFWGYIDRIVPNARDRECYIYCVDLFRLLANQTIRTPLFNNKTETELFQEILDAVQPGIPTDLDVAVDTMPYAWWEQESALDAALDLARHVNGFVFASREGEFVYQNRDYRAKSPRNLAQDTFDNNMVDLHYNRGDREIRNDVTTKAYQRVVGATTDIWQLPDTPKLTGGQTRVFWAALSDPADTIFAPVSGTDVTAHSNPEGTGVSRVSDLTLTLTTYAQSVKVEVENTSNQELWVTLLKLQGDPLTIRDRAEAQTEDAASITQFGRKSDNFDGRFLPDLSKAAQRSREIVARRKDAFTTLEITLAPRDEVLIAQMLIRDLSDRVRVTEDRVSVDSDFYIEKVVERVRPPGYFEVDWTLTSIPGRPSDWFASFILNQTSLGERGLAY